MKRKLLILAVIAALIIAVTCIGVVASDNAADADVQLNIQAKTLSFEESVHIIFAVSYEGVDAEDVTMLYWTSPLENADDYTADSAQNRGESNDTQTVNGVSCLTFENTDLWARNMTDTLYARAYAKVDGKEYYSDVISYSIIEYAYNKLGYTGTATTDTKLITLLNDLLEYGADVQNYFGYKTDDLPTDAHGRLTVSGAVLPDGLTTGIYKLGQSVTLRSALEDASEVQWLDSDGRVLGYGETLTVTVSKTSTVITAEEYDSETPTEIPALTVNGFDLSKVPEYDGSVDYVQLNGGEPYFTENQITDEAYEYYSDLDGLSRCGTAVACLGTELLPTGDRGSLSHNPTAWHSSAIYERCHLIAWSLAGENNNAKNLITGTYDLNSVMQTFEDMVLDYIRETSNHVMYRVTPVFEGNNLLASGVVMEAWSVEDKGEGICFSIYIYNAQDDCIIDYSDGDYEDLNTATYIVNKNGYKIHKATCSGARDMKDENKLYYYCTLEEVENDLKAKGKSYSYCGNCKPQNG